MKLERYELTAGENLTTFEFISEGPKGKILKVIQFQPMSLKNLFNLAFGDQNIKTGEIDDNIVSNNGDYEKVLATVVDAVYAFSNKNKESWIYITGSTDSRNRLYRMGITKYFDEISKDFEILGEYNNEWELFEFGKNYEAFAVHKKNNNFEI